MLEMICHVAALLASILALGFAACTAPLSPLMPIVHDDRQEANYLLASIAAAAICLASTAVISWADTDVSGTAASRVSQDADADRL